ncbi:MAG: hypothetical protein IKA98_05475 [Candidatus Methanomethylophilaceae archaeon]|nr:hypothetical protein [Candidatus Methanomethylophilaceae archaeon]
MAQLRCRSTVGNLPIFMRALDLDAREYIRISRSESNIVLIPLANALSFNDE